jgi:hypothetical protein
MTQKKQIDVKDVLKYLYESKNTKRLPSEQSLTTKQQKKANESK